MADKDFEKALDELRALEEAADEKRREIAEAQAAEREFLKEGVESNVRGSEDERQRSLGRSLNVDVKSVVRDDQGNVVAVTPTEGEALRGGEVLQRSVGEGLARAVLGKSTGQGAGRAARGHFPTEAGPPISRERQAMIDREREEFFRKLAGQ